MQNAKLILGGKEYEFPIVVGAEGERAFDCQKLRETTGHVTMDPGYGNTGACKSAITFIDGEKGILRYRGYPIEDLAQRASFLDVARLLIYGELPQGEERRAWHDRVTHHTLLHEDMKKFFEGYPRNAHPMAILAAMFASLSTFYPEGHDGDVEHNMVRLMAKAPTIAAFSYKKSVGQPFIYPRNDLDYCSNFLNMMFAVPSKEYSVSPAVRDALNLLLILHADHEQNCSTSTVRMVGSSRGNLFAAMAAGVSALWGPLHGGANQEVIEMLQRIKDDGGDTEKAVAAAKDRDSGFRLMGFGHRVYKNFDPRAKILKKTADRVLDELGVQDPLLDIAKKLEATALEDEYFVERKLYPNVDFYSGIIYRAIGIPTDMFTVMFALGRLPGWLAHWKEQRDDPKARINRPRQIYTGATERRLD